MSYPLLDVFLTIVWFFGLLLWILLVICVLMDIFGRRDLGGWAKAGWTLLVIVVPLIGVLVYMGLRAGAQDRRDRQVLAQDAAFRAGRPSTAWELSELADLHDSGVITDAEFEKRKEVILSSDSRPAR